MRLYGIQPEELEQAIRTPDRTDLEGRYQVAYKAFPGCFGGKPLKVVYAAEGDVVVITAYPLQKALRR
jgi:hypothetical protein